MPNEKILLDKTVIVTYRGMMEICGSSGSFRVLYEEHCSRGVIRNAVVHRVSPSSEQIDDHLLDSTFIAKSSKKFLKLEFRNVTSASSSDAISASDSEGVGGNKESPKESPHSVVKKNLAEDFEKTDKAKGGTPKRKQRQLVKSDPTNSKSDNKAKCGTPGTAKLKLLVEVPKPRTDGKESPSTTPLGDPENSKTGKKRKRRQLVKSGGSSTDEETPTPFLPLNKSDNAEDGFAVPKPRTRLVKPTSSTSDNKAKGGTPGTAKLKLLVEVPTDGKESPSTSTDDFDGGSSTDEETPTPFLPPTSPTTLKTVSQSPSQGQGS
jgi:hypothetical protein